MGEVFHPENLTGRGLPKPVKPGDVRPSIPQPPSLEILHEQVKALWEELEKIKRALRRHGIALEE